MATARSEWIAVYVIFSTISIHFDLSTAIRVQPTLGKVQEWSNTLDTYWDTHISTLTGFYDIQPEYRHQYPRPKNSPLDVGVEFRQVDTVMLVNEMASDLSEMLGRKMKALNYSVMRAEAVAANYSWNPKLEKAEMQNKYENAKDMDLVLSHDERFGQEVNFSSSSVHIPVEIYDGDLEILNGLNWTSYLDSVFAENYKNDPEILWQYFGSQAGFMRTYPASAWKTRGPVDLYDVRRQSWYTQGSSSPKDMMILIDTSGSTHGQALQLMKVAVKSILDTLGENDFVNIAEFSSDAKFVSRCFNHTPFVQANYRNKQRLSNDVSELTATGMANFKAGLRFAFEQFKRFERNETSDQDDDKQFGANCNKVIMMLTDGGTDNAEEIFKEFNWPNKTVRVFTYAVGPTANPTNAIRWMACANRGYFSPIPAMGAIRTRVQDYTKALVGPKEYYYGQSYNWEVTRDPRGLGMMTTVTLPVYNRTDGSSNQTILGVMGIDVTTADMVKKSPQQKLGPNGYSFAINPNGYIIFHPNLKATNYMRDPPNVDLLEIEVSSAKKNELRTAMVKQEKGSVVLDTYVMSPDMNYVSKDNVTYSYQPIDGTSFSLGMSLPSYQSLYPHFNGDMKHFENFLKSKSWETLIAPWNYYEDMIRNAGNLTGTVQDITDILDNDPDSVKWNKDMLYHLYWDAKIVSSVNDYFVVVESRIVVNRTNGKDSDTEGHVLSFISTNGGLTRVFPRNESSVFMDHRDPMKANYYKRILSSEKQVFFIEPFSQAAELGNTTIAPDVTVGRSLTIKNDNDKTVYKPAVLGVKLTNKKVVDILLEKTKDSEENYHDCRDSDILSCYLVDDGGFLIASNQEEHNLLIGQFLGKVDPPVMTRLLNASVYERFKHYDYQVTHDCSEPKKEVSAGFSSFRIPSLNLLYDALTLNWWTSKFAWAYLNFNFWNSFFSSSEVYGEDDTEGGIMESCVEVMYQYYYGSRTTLSDSVECENCTRKIMASRLDKNTNLLLVVADPICSECDPYYSPLPQEPVKVSQEEEEEVICDLARTPRYRRPIQECYSQDDREDATKCDGNSSHCPSTLSLLTSLLLILLSIHGLTSPHS